MAKGNYPRQDPYTHEIRGLLQYTTLIYALRNLGFVLRENKDYTYTNVGRPGTKADGASGVEICFQNAYHADAVRLALDQRMIGPWRVLCQRAGDANQKQDDGQRPPAMNPQPDPQVIYQAVLDAYREQFEQFQGRTLREEPVMAEASCDNEEVEEEEDEEEEVDDDDDDDVMVDDEDDDGEDEDEDDDEDEDCDDDDDNDEAGDEEAR
ncbi:hypothetical protein ACLMJK_004372 [Lecanora helva]